MRKWPVSLQDRTLSLSFQPEEPSSNHAGADLAVTTLFGDAEIATLSDRIYAALREGLMIGEWLPGATITDRNVAKQYSTSLSPARDAMTRLANEGGLLLSETRMYSVPVLTDDDYCEVMNVSLALEPMEAELSNALMGDEDI